MLSPGRPAGIKQAMSKSERKEIYAFAAVFVIATGAAIALIRHKDNSASTSTSP
jgi:hypothetical protein